MVQLGNVADMPAFMAAFDLRMLRRYSRGGRLLAAAEQLQLQNNVTTLSEELEGNHGRGGVLARLGAGIATKQIAALAGCSVRTMQRAKKDQRENPARDKRFKETLPLHRIRVPINEKLATIRWLHEICPS